RTAHRGRRIRNDAMKRDLDVTLLYPSFVEGEAAVEREEAGGMPTGAAPPVTGPRPDFVKNVAVIPWESDTYPGSTQPLGAWQQLGEAVGVTHFGVSVTRLPPGCRSSYPHAHSAEEEWMYVLEGTPDVWIDGELVRLGPGDVVGFKAGTGIVHTTINNT